MTKFLLAWLLGAPAAFIALISPAQAQQIYAAPAGSGSNCNAATPCSLNTALRNVGNGGFISCIGGGFAVDGYAPPNSFTLDCPGAVITPSVPYLPSQTYPSLTISGTSTQVVTLRNLTFDGGGATYAPFIKVTGGATLIIENCKFQNLAIANTNVNNIAIQFLPSSPAAQLIIRDTVFSNNGVAPSSGGGLQVSPAAGGSASVLLERVSFHYNITSMVLNGAVSAVMKNSTVSASRSNGIIVSNGATLAIKDSLLEFNVGSALNVSGGSIVRLSNTDLENNQTGVSNSGGSVLSYSNNRIVANSTNGTPLATIQGGQ